MNTKQTITVIGPVGNEIYSICQNLSSGHYRLILCGNEKKNMEAVAAKIKTKVVTAEVETQDCIIDASWEADLIIVEAAEDNVKEIADKIREVANQKIVMIAAAGGMQCEWPPLSQGTMLNDDLQQLLPNSKLVRLYFQGSDIDMVKQPEGNNVTALFRGIHKVDLSVVADLLKEAGCDVIIRDDPEKSAAERATAYR